MAIISHVVILGDSLSAVKDDRRLFGIIPFSWLAGLTGKSPLGRFTDGYAWSDYTSAAIAHEYLIKSKEARIDLSHSIAKDNAADSTDASLNHESKNKEKNPRFDRQIENNYILNKATYFKYEGKEFIRNYAEGGLTSHDYSWWPSTSLTRFFSRLILATLGNKRDTMLEYDARQVVPQKQKEQTLVIEWSGANDLITVNAEPSYAAADRAIRDRLNNIRILMEKGYRNFVVCNLPDLSLTPRFQNKDDAAIQNAHNVVTYFNAQLSKALSNFKAEGCTFDVFDVNQVFTDVWKATYNNSPTFGNPPQPNPFKKELLQRSYTTDTNPQETGYLFWDDVHPSEIMHETLAKHFQQTILKKHTITRPEADDAKTLISKFITRYKHDISGPWSLFKVPNLRVKMNHNNPTETLACILKHALLEHGKRSYKVMQEIGWIDANGKVNIEIPGIKAAMDLLRLKSSLADNSRLNRKSL